MIRAAGIVGLLGFAALVLLGLTPNLTRPGPASLAMASQTPPATPLTGNSRFETSGAVPVSLSIENDGAAGDILLGGDTPIAERVEVHRTLPIDGSREMQFAPHGLPIPAGELLILEPGGSHLMLVGMRTGLLQGETFPLTQKFDRAGDVTVTVRVRRRVDAAGVTPIPPVTAGALTISFASASPAAGGTPKDHPN